MNGSNITLPKKVFKEFVQAADVLERAQSELEDYILSQSSDFLVRMRKARKEHKAGQFVDWQNLKSKYGV